MSIRVTWQPSTDPIIASYLLEKSAAPGGPWATVATVPHTIPGANWDSVNTVFFYVDSSGNESTFYRLTAIDSLGQSSAPSAPFRAPSALVTGLPNHINVISIPAGDAAALLNLGFTTIEVYESTDDANSWHEVTDSLTSSATVSSAAASNTFRIGGFSLSFKVNGGDVKVVSFSTVITYWTPQQVVDRINQVAAGVASLSGSSVVLSSITGGRESSIQVLSSPPELDFPTDLFFGRDQRIDLVDNVFLYTYYDVAGSATSRYRWRFSNFGAEPFSKFSSQSLGSSMPVSGVPLTLAVAYFIDMSGKPVPSSVIISPVSPQIVNGYITGAAGTMVVNSDAEGFFQMPLVIGSKIRVAIEGTALVREFVVPNVVSFDLLQVMTSAPDQFTVQTPAPLLTRRSL
jgi:hypothetical protein